jgi:hypothetical protein
MATRIRALENLNARQNPEGLLKEAYAGTCYLRMENELVRVPEFKFGG